MHDWGDDNVDWNGINNAARYIAEGLVKWGRVNVRDYKEKYGTVRIYCSLGWYGLHSITHPRHVYSRYPKWLWSLDCHYGRYLVRPLNWLVIPYHKFLYRKLYRNAVQKWPHLMVEILSAADFHELLEDVTPEWKIHHVSRAALNKDIEYLRDRIWGLQDEVTELRKQSSYSIQEEE